MATDDRPELADAFTRLARWLIDAERPILQAHGLTMWQYVVLSELARGPAQTQLALARAISHDKTRLIPLLEGLEADGLIARTPDPADRRARIVELTSRGAGLRAEVAAEIRTMEDDFLASLRATDRTGLLKALKELNGLITTFP